MQKPGRVASQKYVDKIGPWCQEARPGSLPASAGQNRRWSPHRLDQYLFHPAQFDQLNSA